MIGRRSMDDSRSGREARQNRRTESRNNLL